MKKLPCLLYRSPGTHRMPGLDAPTYDYIGAATEEEYRKHIANGWLPTRDEAIGRKVADAAVEAAEGLHEATEDVPEQGRKELEAQAKALGVGFNWKTSDQALAEKIATRKDEA